MRSLRRRGWCALLVVAVGLASPGCGSSGGGDDARASDGAGRDGVPADGLPSDGLLADAGPGAGDGGATADGPDIPDPDGAIPSCTFITPSDGDTIADVQAYMEVQTRNVSPGTVVAMLVAHVPQATAQVSADGKAEFPSVALPPPSTTPVELRAELRLTPSHKTSCSIHVTVAGP